MGFINHQPDFFYTKVFITPTWPSWRVQLGAELLASNAAVWEIPLSMEVCFMGKPPTLPLKMVIYSGFTY